MLAWGYRIWLLPKLIAAAALAEPCLAALPLLLDQAGARETFVYKETSPNTLFIIKLLPKVESAL